MNSFTIRQKFLEYFKKNGHIIVPSSSLIPAQDPTLLFANAGMNQFKDVFLGKEKRSYARATSSQKCVRAGGKHNDLDEVGFTARHLTFFEMLGNFSFGDYFKKEAIHFAWELLTKEFCIAPERLCVSVYTTDDEAYNLWHTMIGVPQEKIYRLGEKENFWQMGDTGPCGPCTEIHIDYGVDKGCRSKGCDPSCSCGRFVEIWNLVFMQYNRQTDGTLLPLTKTGVDTGMGLERVCMVLQDKKSVFESDLFEPLRKKIEQISGVDYAKSSTDTKAAFHVLCDHVRSSSLLIADGCSPSNDGRGYVLRKIIRRAALFAQKLTDDQMLLAKVAHVFIETMAPVFENLKTSEPLIINVLTSEVERFATNLLQGQQIFEKYVQINEKTNSRVISGEQVFKLYDTYGFPSELTRVMALEKGFGIDMDGFEKEMEKQRQQSGKQEVGGKELQIPLNIQTTFVGYESLEVTSKIIFVQVDGESVWIVTSESPFYVESGGQGGDNGWLTINHRTYSVKQLKKIGGGQTPAIAVQIIVSGEDVLSLHDIKIGASVLCVVDNFKRLNSGKNHTATHLLQAALVQVLGKQVKQAGSLVTDEYLRFDFSHHEALTKEQLEKVEQLVNTVIQENKTVTIVHTTLSKAQEAGATAFFGEKYNPEHVRVVSVPGFSAELCGGTHVRATGDIGCFKIVSEAALATGTRRIVGVTGPKAVELFAHSFTTIKGLSELFKTKPEQVFEAVQKQQETLMQALRDVKQLKKQIVLLQIPIWGNQVSAVNGIPFLFLNLKDVAGDELKIICAELEKLTTGFFFLLSQDGQDQAKFSFYGFVSKEFLPRVNLERLGILLKDQCALRGGGKKESIQGGGVNVVAGVVKNTIEEWLKKV